MVSDVKHFPAKYVRKRRRVLLIFLTEQSAGKEKCFVPVGDFLGNPSKHNVTGKSRKLLKKLRSLYRIKGKYFDDMSFSPVAFKISYINSKETRTERVMVEKDPKGRIEGKKIRIDIKDQVALRDALSVFYKQIKSLGLCLLPNTISSGKVKGGYYRNYQWQRELSSDLSDLKDRGYIEHLGSEVSNLSEGDCWISSHEARPTHRGCDEAKGWLNKAVDKQPITSLQLAWSILNASVSVFLLAFVAKMMFTFAKSIFLWWCL